MNANLDNLTVKAGFSARIGSAIPVGHPEAVCDDCNGANVAWHAPSPFWNKVARPSGESEHEPMLCPRCFIVRAEAAGIREVWLVAPESDCTFLCVIQAKYCPPPPLNTGEWVDWITTNTPEEMWQKLASNAYQRPHVQFRCVKRTIYDTEFGSPNDQAQARRANDPKI